MENSPENAMIQFGGNFPGSMLQQFQLIMQVNLCSSPAFDGGGTQIVSQFEMEML